MKTYQVIIKRLGEIIDTTYITALNSLKAIEIIERKYQPKTVQLSSKNGQVENYSWTGYEFECREMKMVLS